MTDERESEGGGAGGRPDPPVDPEDDAAAGGTVPTGVPADEAELAGRIDHTVLGPATTPEDVRRLMAEAEEYGTNACVPPCYVDEATAAAPDVTVATVVGFPHGQHAPAVKQAEAERAWEAGADELDVVINVGRLTAGQREAVREEIAGVVACVPVPVKVIIETALLTDEDKHAACGAARAAGAEFVKTSTGFAEGGATVADVELMSEFLPVKASGGIGDYDAARAMFEAGATRIGASSGVAIVEDYRRRQGGDTGDGDRGDADGVGGNDGGAGDGPGSDGVRDGDDGY